MEKFSALVAKELNIDDHEMDGDRPKNYAAATDRYSIHKVGPVLSVSVSGFFLSYMHTMKTHSINCV